MHNTPITEVVRHFRKIVLLHQGAGVTDAQLLGCFLEHRDEAAFAALVKRHGPMVWGVLRRVLRDYQDAEDAFQATFLVLVRKAASILPREMVGNWLYGVAHQTALKARATRARRKERERLVTVMPQPAVMEEELWTDLQPVLDQELSRLPDKFRAVILLCDLQGKTRKEAARQLGCPEGTVASRLATARAMLAKRLARHGLAVSTGALAAVLSSMGASASVPDLVSSSTMKAVSLVAAGQAATAVVSAKVAALTEGVIKVMFAKKLMKAMALLCLVGVVGALASGPAQRTQAASQSGASDPAAQAPAERAGKEKERDAKALFSDLKERVRAGVEEMNQALWKGEYGKVVDLTHPELVEMEGGREKAMATMRRLMNESKSKGMALRSFKVGEPKAFLVTSEGMFVAVPTSTEVALGLGKRTAHSLNIGISGDGGKTWKFVIGDPAALKKHLPDLLPEELSLPALP